MRSLKLCDSLLIPTIFALDRHKKDLETSVFLDLDWESKDKLHIFIQSKLMWLSNSEMLLQFILTNLWLILRINMLVDNILFTDVESMVGWLWPSDPAGPRLKPTLRLHLSIAAQGCGVAPPHPFGTSFFWPGYRQGDALRAWWCLRQAYSPSGYTLRLHLNSDFYEIALGPKGP